MHGRKLSGQRHLVIESEGKKFVMTVNLPARGRLNLKNLKLKPKTVTSPKASGASSSIDGTAEAEDEEITIEGTLTSVDCAAIPPTVTVTTSDGSIVKTPFDPATTQIINEQTGLVITACSDLAVLTGTTVEVEAKVKPDGSLFALQILVNPDQDEESDLEFEGTIASTSCPGSLVVTRSGDGVPVTVNLSGSTKIEVSDESTDSSATCTDLGKGMFVQVAGVLQPDGSVNADSVEVKTQEFQADGTINSTNCGATPQSMLFTPDASSTMLTVTIGPGTEIEVNGIDAAVCSDLTLAPAHVEGVTQPDASVAATDIEQGD
jgi:hypothetical protein